jgi:stearoyl-CoA desaturase (delta-9 desaturase)
MKRVPSLPDEHELDLPGIEQQYDGPLARRFEQPQSRMIDRVLAGVVTFVPVIAVMLAIYLHVIGWYQIGMVEIGMLLMMHAIAVCGVELGFHRLFAHKSYSAKRWLRICLAGMGSMGFQGPVIWWAAIHRKHHVHSDRPNDPHSMYIRPGGTTVYNEGFWQHMKGFWHSHVGWIWTPLSIRAPGWNRYVKDLYKDPDILHVHVNYIYWLAAGFVIPGVLSGLIYMSWQGVVLGILWGGFVRIFVMNHLTYWSINTLSHSVGSRPYRTADRSTNSIPLLMAVPTLGQSYHNNHHAFPYSARMAYEWYELDLGLGILNVLKACGQVSDMRQPSKEKRDAKKTRP